MIYTSKDKSMSIHPRVVNGRTAHEKVNTSKPRGKAHLQSAIAGTERHLEEHPRDSFSQMRLAKFNKRLHGG